MSTTLTEMRLDKWLWAARFFKTRALAQKHIELNRIRVNGERVKNSKIIKVGDIIDMQLNSLPWRLTVSQLNMQRRPAIEAQRMYQEDQNTQAHRESLKLMHQASRIEGHYTEGRPTKKDRRQLEKFWHQNQ